MKLLRTLISYLLFPGTFVTALWGASQAASLGHPKEWILAAVIVVTAALIAICERLHPAYAQWNSSQKDVGTDAWHALVSMILLPHLLETGLRVALLGLAVALSERLGGSIWPGHWPILAQLILAMLISQFFEYWVHRKMHESALLWRLHATHHSPGRLYWLNAARFHPIDAAASFSVSLISLLVVGAGPEVMLLVSSWIAVHGMFQHCNVDVRLGPLNYLFSMAELHRWHHSLRLEEANANYGNNILLWDLIFGTVYYPKDQQARAEIGLSDMDTFPGDYLGQLLSPFRWQQLEAKASQEPPPQ